MTKDKIYRLALASGFHPEEQPDGAMDVHPFVYEFAQRMLNSLSESERKLSEIETAFYGKNLHVAGWHLNGELEPMDSFFEDNCWFT